MHCLGLQEVGHRKQLVWPLWATGTYYIAVKAPDYTKGLIKSHGRVALLTIHVLADQETGGLTHVLEEFVSLC